MNITILDCFDTWEHRVDLLMNILVEEGHNVQVLISDYCHIKKIRRLEKKEKFRFFSAEPYNRNMSFRRLHSHVRLGMDMFQWVEKHEKDIDILWVLAPPNSFVKKAGTIKQKYHHIKLVIDLIDLWPETMPLEALKRFPMFYVWRILRDKSLKHADIVVTECDLYRHELKKSLKGIKTKTLYLAREDKGYNPELNLPKDKIALCYLGSINNIIDIPAIGEIIKQFSEKKPVVFHIIGEGEKEQELFITSKKAGAEVVFHGAVYDRNVKKKIFDSCHFGLNVMKDSVCVGLTMKSIDYFEFGLPIINNIKGDTWRIIEKYNCGINWMKKTRISLPYNFQRNKAREFFEEKLTENIFEDKLKEILDILTVS